MAELKITQTKSIVSEKPAVRATVKALGLKRIGDSVTQADRPEIRGMIRAARHLVVVEEVK
ncbi:large subunit ribosomal protein L30 [Propionibacterium cyclohexanicum]|uniref:Large ribosomal subunit protein uL30 n=1 Tax=Propionibacterium cyclohexanicum TaxID=64702 RepID=A0A1H9S374_9ACTN|nr:50S ribosomal protein L30 [Propionibacterium cyclohexanicum]SER79460.1 large subunit ribosomal protein L30 [Propionibacterium cyclohexanicum]